MQDPTEHGVELGMDQFWIAFATVFVDPIGAVPTFATLTGHRSFAAPR